MILCVDIGNTNVTVGVFRGDVLVQSLRFSTNPKRTSDDYAAALLPLLAVFPEAVAGVVLAGVVAGVTDSWQRLVATYLGVEPLVVTPGFAFGFVVAYEPPASVGVDRLVNIFAARNLLKSTGNKTEQRYENAPQGGNGTDLDDENSRFQSLSPNSPPIIVVDFGTATTMDVLTHENVYIGGAIWPGIATGYDALRAITNLPRVALVVTSDSAFVGNTTASSLQVGLLHGEAARVDGLVSQAREQVGDDAVVFFTGGLAHLVAPISRTPGVVHAPDLTLHGLLLAHRVHQNNHATRVA